MVRKAHASAVLVAVIVTAMSSARAATAYSNGFETGTAGWSGAGSSTIERRASGASGEDYASGIASAAGSYHARLRTGLCDPSRINCTGPRTDWGGQLALPVGGAVTEIAIYLDTAWAAAHPDARFDWSSALSDDAGEHLQDFVFNVGTDPAGAARFIVSAGSNATRASSYPSDPARDPHVVSTSGWYLFRHTFRASGSGASVDLTLRAIDGTVQHAWTLPVTRGGAAVARSSVGALRYGAFANQEIGGLAIDASAARDLVPAIAGPQTRSLRGSPVQISGTGEPDVPVAIREGASTLATVTPDASGAWIAIFPLTEGTHTVRAVSVLAGWESLPSPAIAITVDLTAPTAPTISQPLSGSINPVRVPVGGFSEPGASIVLREGGKQLGTTVADDSGRWTMSVDLIDGSHAVTAQATDAAGFTSPESAARSFVVDAYVPAVEISGPAPGSVNPPGMPIAVRGTAADDRGTASVRVEIDDVTGNTVRTAYAVCTGCSERRAEWRYAPTGLAPGLYTVTVHAFDLAGNRSLPAGTSFVMTI